jgi:hypothetical protein
MTHRLAMAPRLRKLVLTVHLVASVGWLGAVVAYIALDVTATTGQDIQTVRAAYLAMDLTVRYVIVPMALAALLTGIIQSLGTTWGLLRHYWVVLSLLLTLFAITVLQAETRTIGHLAEQAASVADPRELPGSLPHSIGGLVVLLTVTILNVFKPRGLTRYGWRRQQSEQSERRVRSERRETRSKTSRTVVAGAGLALALAAGALAWGMFGGESTRRTEVAEKGRSVMPFDLERTTHRFAKTGDGGVQTVVADEPGDQNQVRLIREHLAKEITRFRRGDFSDPSSIHGPDMPGLTALSRGYTRIQMRYETVPTGARITFSTKDTSLVGALHAWFDAQVNDHGRHAEHG